MSSVAPTRPHGGGGGGGIVVPAVARKLVTAPTSTSEDAAILSAFSGVIAPVRPSLVYRLWLLLVALVMLLLPMVYLGMVALVACGVYTYVVDVTGIRGARRRGESPTPFLYFFPIVIGGVLILFMIKPLFARRRNRGEPVTLRPLDEPLLFNYVHKLCDMLGAPRPARIDMDTRVNASASFRGGPFAFVRRDLVLTIGLPLVTGMDLRQLTGVLAHELGHFAQGGAMRLTYIVRSINSWFARVIYERDSMDWWLIRNSRRNN